MVGTFKEFYHFVKSYNPELINIWEDYNNAPDPKKGDKYLVKVNGCWEEMTFNKVEFCPTFKNGVQHNYFFKDKDNNDYIIHSINYVEDPNKLSKFDNEYLFGFWKYCKPI